MKKNTLIDYLILLCVYVALSCFPFELFIENTEIKLILASVVQAILLPLILIYIKRNKTLEIQENKFNFKALLLLIPCYLAVFSNYIYALCNGDQLSFTYSNEVLIKIVLYVFVAINEEILFRLVLYSNFKRKNDILKILICSAIFGIFHITTFLSTFNPFDLIKIVYTFGIGVILGFLYCYSKNLIPCIVFHFLFNVFNEVIFENMNQNNDLNYLTFIIVNLFVAVVIGFYLLALYLLKFKKECNEK